jgi:hypothetical protein
MTLLAFHIHGASDSWWPECLTRFNVFDFSCGPCCGFWKLMNCMDLDLPHVTNSWDFFHKSEDNFDQIYDIPSTLNIFVKLIHKLYFKTLKQM